MKIPHQYTLPHKNS